MCPKREEKVVNILPIVRHRYNLPMLNKSHSYSINKPDVYVNIYTVTISTNSVIFE